MRVLTITGDKSFAPGNPRYDLQASAVEGLAAVYWGWGSLAPRIPPGAYDVVTVQDPFWRGLFALRLARKLGARLNVQVHTDLAAQGLVKRALARRVLRAADSVRVVSQAIRRQVEALGVRAPVVVLPIWVDLSKYSGLVHVPHAHRTVLWVGRFEPEKDPLNMVDIFLDIRRELPQYDVRLVMLGAGSMEPALRARAKNLGLGESASFPGWRDPLPYYAQADVLVVTSRYEGYGAAMLEALAAGAPVVAPDVGVAREAGATVVPRERLAQAAAEALRTGARGELKLSLLAKESWAAAWARSLS